MTDSAVLQIFRDTDALLEGHFLLRSGLHSRQFFQCALVLQYPRHAETLCRALADKLQSTGAQTVISPALAKTVLGWAPTVALEDGLLQTAQWFRKR